MSWLFMIAQIFRAKLHLQLKLCILKIRVLGIAIANHEESINSLQLILFEIVLHRMLKYMTKGNCK